jgi:hypothetical protein
MAMHQNCAEKRNEELKFQAALHGVDLDKDQSPSEKTQSPTGEQAKDLKKVEEKQGLPIFRNPDDYDHMSQEERDKLTKDMMKKHKNWAEQGSAKILKSDVPKKKKRKGKPKK